MQIPVSKFFTMPIEVKAGSVVEWHWTLESGNINSVVRFKASGQTQEQEQEVYKGERITDHKGNFSVPEDGTISFFFDNSFSWLASKVVVGMIDIHSCVCAKQPNPSFLDTLHPEQSELRVRDLAIVHCRQTQSQHSPRVFVRNHAVVPQPRRAVQIPAFSIVFLQNRLLKRLFFLRTPRSAYASSSSSIPTSPLDRIALHRAQNRRGLHSAHHRNPAIRIHVQKTRGEGAACHSVVPSAITAADDERNLRRLRGGDRVDELRA